MDAAPFPRELYDIVINNFRDDIPTLKNVALVDRASANLCQSYIFHEITLRTQRTESTAITATPCYQLHNILLSSPHLATRIKDLTVDNREPCDHDSEKFPYVMFVDEDDFLPTVLDKLPNVASIRLLMDSTWPTLPPRLQSSIERIFMSDNLRSITLLALHEVPLSLFRASRGLHRICWLDTSIVPDMDSNVDSRCQLETLELIIDDPAQLLGYPSPFDLTHLQRISIALGSSFRNHTQSLTTLFRNNIRTLEYLGLHICRWTIP
jgi:hypothetical protein